MSHLACGPPTADPATDMPTPLDRRSFLRSLSAVAAAAGLPLAGCAGNEAPEGGEDEERPVARLASIVRPILLPHSGSDVRIEAPLAELPMAYVSMALRQVFVDHAFRDRSNWILDAHISVSTGLWRIPLPGDPVGMPIPPGDTLREFEELDIAEWDSAMAPAGGDFRIRRGSIASSTVDFDCVPVEQTGEWISAGPFDLRHCHPAGEDSCREDFVAIGEGLRRPLRGCADAGTPIRIFGWSAND